MSSKKLKKWLIKNKIMKIQSKTLLEIVYTGYKTMSPISSSRKRTEKDVGSFCNYLCLFCVDLLLPKLKAQQNINAIIATLTYAKLMKGSSL